MYSHKKAAKKQQENFTSDEICSRVIDERKNLKLQMLGIASSNIRRQLKRLKELFLIEKVKNNYRITEFDSLINTFEEKIDQMIRDKKELADLTVVKGEKWIGELSNKDLKQLFALG